MDITVIMVIIIYRYYYLRKGRSGNYRQRKTTRDSCDAMRSHNPLVRAISDISVRNPISERALGTPKTGWKDTVKDVEELEGGTHWKYLATNRNGRRIGCEKGRS
ncbi:Hypothetical protein CINCED_3A013158 [Cinara cedri]|uniref:Uncharacterized protein n=1 Tax=Cinara cedri TaxID=506608 RepID=A0A5E4M0I6_9HEMI|nr:Hypothetical protein CINCED_3A013158 [Cinara cedri]